jgi:hypothetical protein
VFANIRSTHRLDRFSHRGRRKVTTQWQLYCLVHNVGKVQPYAQLGMSSARGKRMISNSCFIAFASRPIGWSVFRTISLAARSRGGVLLQAR